MNILFAISEIRNPDVELNENKCWKCMQFLQCVLDHSDNKVTSKCILVDFVPKFPGPFAVKEVFEFFCD